MRNLTDRDDGDSWHTVDDHDDDDDDNDLMLDDGINYNPVADQHIRNHHSDGHGSDGAAAPFFLHLDNDGLVANDNAVNLVPDALDVAADADGNNFEDNNAHDARNEINNDDEWEIDDWNEGMREGWDWVPLPVVYFYAPSLLIESAVL